MINIKCFLRNSLSIFALAQHSTAAPLRAIVSFQSVGSTYCQSADPCAGTNYNATLATTYICGDYRLGPISLPTATPLSDLSDLPDIVHPYDRLGGLCPGAYLGQWWTGHFQTVSLRLP